MKPWRPKRRKQGEDSQDSQVEPREAPARGFFDATGLTGRFTRTKGGTQSLRRVRMKFIHNAALIPPAVGVGVLVLLPFILTSSPPVQPPPGSGHNQILLGRDGAPVQLTVPEGAPGQTRQVSIGEALYTDALSLEDRRQAARQLGGQRQPESLRALIRASQDDDPEARRLSCYGLVRRLDDPEAQAALARLLDDEEQKVSMATAAALGTVERGGYLLLDRLRLPDTFGAVHAACLRGLHYTGTPDLVPLLMPFVQEGGDRAQAAAHTVWMICKRTETALPPDLPPVGRR